MARCPTRMEWIATIVAAADGPHRAGASEKRNSRCVTSNPAAVRTPVHHALDSASSELPVKRGERARRATIALARAAISTSSLADRTSPPETDVLGEPHQLFRLAERIAGNFVCTFGAGRERSSDFGFICANGNGFFPDRRKLSLHRFVQHLLAVDATPSSGATLNRDVIDGFRWTECLVQMVDIADFRRSRISAPYTFWIGDRGPQLLPDVLRILQQTNSAAQGLRHLRLPVQSHDSPCRRQQGLWLRKKPGVSVR